MIREWVTQGSLWGRVHVKERRFSVIGVPGVALMGGMQGVVWGIFPGTLLRYTKLGANGSWQEGCVPWLGIKTALRTIGRNKAVSLVTKRRVRKERVVHHTGEERSLWW